MTFRFNTLKYDRKAEGMVLICAKSNSGYFTEGKKYPIGIGSTGDPYLTTDCGMKIHQTSSLFITKPPLTPKQPKAGEVWCFQPLGDDYNNDGALYHVVSVVNGEVRHRTIGGSQKLYEDTVEMFIENHVFVF